MYYDRQAWGARDAKGYSLVPMSERVEIFLHHTTGDELGDEDTLQWVRNIQDYHMDVLGWADIGYSFLVDRYGNIFEGRGWDREGAHTRGHNRTGHGIAFLGDGDVVGDGTYTGSMSSLTALKNLFDEADVRAGRKLVRHNHNEVYATHCPGEYLSAWLVAGMPIDGSQGTPSAPAPAPEPAPEPAPAPQDPIPPLPAYMRLGDRGEGVRAVQQLLSDRGWTIQVDSVWGPQTDRVVRAFQAEKGLDVDGVVGPQTWACLWQCPIT